MDTEQIPIWPTRILGQRTGYRGKHRLLRVCRTYLLQPILSMLTCFSHVNHNKGSGPTWMFPCLTPHGLWTNVFSLYHSNLCTSINYHARFKQTPSITMGLPLSEPLDLNQVLVSAPNSLFPETYVVYKMFSAYVWKQFIMPSHKAAV